MRTVDIYGGFDIEAHTYDALRTNFGIGDAWGYPAPTVPNVTITAGPQGTVTTSDVTFEFVSDVAGASFECGLDAAAWVARTSPYEVVGLANGE